MITSKAIHQTGYGNPGDNLKIFDIKKPQPGPNEVLVRIHYACINPHDYKIVLGDFKRMEKRTMPSPAGSDFSGTIEQTGEGVSRLSVGDKVCQQKNAQYEFVFMRPSAASLELVRSLAKDNIVRSVIEKSFDFLDYVEALKHLAGGHTKGKLTIRILE